MEKGMTNPKNWEIDEIKEAATAIALFVPALVIFYITIWIFY